MSNICVSSRRLFIYVKYICIINHSKQHTLFNHQLRFATSDTHVNLVFFSSSITPIQVCTGLHPDFNQAQRANLHVWHSDTFQSDAQR